MVLIRHLAPCSRSGCTWLVIYCICTVHSELQIPAARHKLSLQLAQSLHWNSSVEELHWGWLFTDWVSCILISMFNSVNSKLLIWSVNCSLIKTYTHTSLYCKVVSLAVGLHVYWMWTVGGLVISLCRSTQQDHFNEKIILHYLLASSKMPCTHWLTKVLHMLNLLYYRPSEYACI